MQAQMKLGVLLSDGFITKPDYVESWVWLKQAASQGNRFADTLARTVERRLTGEQLEDARQRLKPIEKGSGWEGIVPNWKP